MAESLITLHWKRSGFERASRSRTVPGQRIWRPSLGFNRSTVFGWIAAYRKGGAEALRARPVPGRPPKLTPVQMRTLFTMIAGSNPAQYQLDFALWTRDLVRQVIATRFGIDLSVGSVGRILRGLGMSPQRPLHRATQQDPSGWPAGGLRSTQPSETKPRRPGCHRVLRR
jgi:transposase